MGALYRLPRPRTRRSETKAADKPPPRPGATLATAEALARQMNNLEALLESLLWQRNPLAAMKLRR